MILVGAEIVNFLRNLVKKEVKGIIRNSLPCSVISVSGDPVTGLMTCDCKPLDGSAIIEDVQLCANFTDTTTQAGFLLIPSENSIVTVSFKTNIDAYVSMVSLVDAIYLNGNEYHGLVKIQPLITKLNNLENLVNDLITKFNTHTHVLTLTSGTGTAAPTLTQEPNTLTPTQQGDLENTTVKHGASNLI